MNTEVKKQEKLDLAEEKDFRRVKLQGNIQQGCYMDGTMDEMMESLRISI